MILALVLLAVGGAGIGVASHFIVKRRKAAPVPTIAAWPKDQLPLLVLSDAAERRQENNLRSACDAWNKAAHRTIVVYGGETEVEQYDKGAPGIVVVHFVGELSPARPHASLIVRSGKVIASPIYCPEDVEDGLMIQILTHELGHALGLGHASDDRSVMYPTALPWSRAITAKETDAIGRLYP